MHLTSLSLTDYRSYPQLELPFASGITVLVGPNGQGKTNIVESLWYLATLSSHRVPHDAALVRRGADTAIIRAGFVRAGRPLHLGPTEYRLLEFLMQHPGRVFSREQVLDAVWGRDIHVEPRTVDVHIRRLRKAVNGPGEEDVIRTVRSAGYALDSEPG